MNVIYVTAGLIGSSIILIALKFFQLYYDYVTLNKPTILNKEFKWENRILDYF